MSIKCSDKPIKTLGDLIIAANLDVTAPWQNKIELTRNPFKHQIDDLRFMGHLVRSGIYSENPSH